MRTHRARRSTPSQIMAIDNRPTVSKIVLGVGILVASFGAAALGVVLAASSIAG